MKPWWELWPERLEWELNALRSAGVDYKILEQDPKTGALRLSFPYRVNGEVVALEAAFPCFYPYTRCEIIAPELALRWHQNPYNRNLCLLGRATANWDTENSLATFLATQLPKVLSAARTEDPEEAKDKEEFQAEPLTSFLPYPRGSVVFVMDDREVPCDAERGHMQFRVAACRLDRARMSRGTLRYCSGSIPTRRRHRGQAHARVSSGYWPSPYPRRGTGSAASESWPFHRQQSGGFRVRR